MAVNISAIQLREENFVDSVFAIFKETGMDPKLLEVVAEQSVHCWDKSPNGNRHDQNSL